MREEKAVTEKKKHKCPPHYFVIDSDNVGHCRYCPEVRDFRKLWEKEERRIWKDPGAGGGKCAAVTILSVMKSMAKGSDHDTSFAEYVHRKSPGVDEDMIIMIQDLLEHPPEG